MNTPSQILEFDLQKTITKNRLVGLWRMLTGFRLRYTGAVVSLGISATAKTLTYHAPAVLCGFLLCSGHPNGIPASARPWHFLGLAAVEGGFTFLSGVLSSQTAEGVTRRLRNYLYNHIQHLSFTYHSKTPTGDLIEVPHLM